jgi:acetate CoA/acetoacetate CoA-transferase alpha subunit
MLAGGYKEGGVVPKPVISAASAVELLKEGMTVHIGGFLGCGSPDTLIAALWKLGTGGLTLVCNDAGIYNPASGRATGPSPLVAAHRFTRLIVSHIGTNPEAQRQMNAGETEVVLVPQGTLAERVRAAGFGLGGFLTPTGVGTEAAEGKQIVTIEGRDYLLELPLPGDVALIKAKRADRSGNLQYAKTARNFNPLMAAACARVIAEVEQIVEIGAIDPDQVHTPSIFVDYLVLSEAGS